MERLAVRDASGLRCRGAIAAEGCRPVGCERPLRAEGARREGDHPTGSEPGEVRGPGTLDGRRGRVTRDQRSGPVKAVRSGPGGGRSGRTSEPGGAPRQRRLRGPRAPEELQRPFSALSAPFARVHGLPATLHQWDEVSSAATRPHTGNLVVIFTEGRGPAAGPGWRLACPPDGELLAL